MALIGNELIEDITMVIIETRNHLVSEVELSRVNENQEELVKLS
jgi:hypothetical protein